LPNIKSAKKRVKVIATKTARNKALKTSLKTAIKKATEAVNSNASNSKEQITLALKQIDKSVSKGIIHKNNAARKKSNLSLKLNKLNA
jgi:small subunit ribosomal protein S20